MNKIDSEVIQKLKEFGFDDNEIKIYILLLQKGALTYLQISRFTCVHRTSVYRAVDRLQKKKLVRLMITEKKQLVEAFGPEIIADEISIERKHLLKKERLLPRLLTDLNMLSKFDSIDTQVRYYKGLSGIKQLLWNITKTPNTDLYGYGYLNWTKMLGLEFSETIRQRHVDNNIRNYEVTNNFPSSFRWTSNEDYLKLYFRRHISKEILEIHHEMFILKDRIAFDSEYDGDAYGIEIINKDIASTQLQLFWLAWEKGQDMAPFKEFVPKE